MRQNYKFYISLTLVFFLCFIYGLFIAVIGSDGEITLRAFVKLSPFGIVRHAASIMGGITFIWLIPMSIITYFTLKKRKRGSRNRKAPTAQGAING
ncbi:MAG: hypothetical protein LBL58_16750 [Tannerellaceae bacterium]|jgi:hypothetical protein|nr:hypothetical protein [Tannerellaceae bacterium]